MFGKVSKNVEAQTHISPPDPGARFRTFYIVRSCLQPYGGPINWKDSRCRDLDPDFEFFGVDILGTIGPQDLGVGKIGKLKVEMGRSGWRGWIDLGEAVWMVSISIRNALTRCPNLRFPSKNVEN